MVENSVLWDGVTVGADCKVGRSILGSSVTLPEKTEVTEKSVIGE